MTLGQKLKELRVKNDLTIAYVAFKAKISETSVSYYENDRNEISLKKYMCLCEIYGVEPFETYKSVDGVYDPDFEESLQKEEYDNEEEQR
ncbi:MAG: helix-turn-helix domain-containing protein [Lachnospiraceae bacterium]|nr:helix-turn-helix domain-containing protein [Lachnospiraceae bacterium]